MVTVSTHTIDVVKQLRQRQQPTVVSKTLYSIAFFYSSIANNGIESFFNSFTTKVRKHSLHVLNTLYRNVLRAGLVVEHFNRNPTLVS